MTYKDGTEVREGDVVLIRHTDSSFRGVVSKLIRPGTIDAGDWSAPEGGVLIEGGGLGLSVIKSLEQDEDVVFVSRASRGPDETE
jgi:hypothetical protein